MHKYFLSIFMILYNFVFITWHNINAELYIGESASILEKCSVNYEQKNVVMKTECVLRCRKQRLIPTIQGSVCFCTDRRCRTNDIEGKQSKVLLFESMGTVRDALKIISTLLFCYYKNVAQIKHFN